MDKIIEEIENFDSMQEKRKQYMKEYYQQNKERLKVIQKKSNFERQKQNLKQKLNKGEYIRKPFMKLQKYGIYIFKDGSFG